MTYKSLFDILLEEDANLKLLYDNIRFCNSLDKIIDELGEALNSNNELSIVKRVLHTPRIIRAIIDYKIDKSYYSEPKRLLDDAIALGLSVYQQEKSSSVKLSDLRFRIINSGHSELLQNQVYQPDDKMVFEDSHPKMNKKTANRLLKETSEKPVLFIAMAHSGIMPGLDTYLRYCDRLDNNDSKFYAVRLSFARWRDAIPKISLVESIKLSGLAEHLQTLLFDEHRVSGFTLDKAKNYFCKTLTLENNIIVDCNVDRRLEYSKLRNNRAENTNDSFST